MKVYKAINDVQKAIGKTGIAKNGEASGFGAGFKFRGIDAVYNALSPLLADAGLVIIPRCLERHESMRESGPKKLYFVAVKMEFDFVSAEDGSKHTACTYGEAMDSGDKATNKAMSIAYKYACFQTFAIPTEGDNDPDATVHAPAQSRQAAPAKVEQQKPQGKPISDLVAEIKSIESLDGLKAVKGYLASHTYSSIERGEAVSELKLRHANLTSEV